MVSFSKIVLAWSWLPLLRLPNATARVLFIFAFIMLIIKQADKGGAVVIMDRQYYSEKITEMLNNEEIYFPLTENIDDKVIQKVKNLTQLHETILTEEKIRYLTDFDCRTSNFYGLPKVHKSRSIITETLAAKN